MENTLEKKKRNACAGDISRLVRKKKLPAVVYGLRGIMELFSVSKCTAWIYRNSFLAPACTQNGNVILVDTEKALMLFSQHQNDAGKNRSCRSGRPRGAKTKTEKR